MSSRKKRTEECHKRFQTFGFVSEPSRKKKHVPWTTNPLSIQHPERKS
jgi:hypothetical protein